MVSGSLQLKMNLSTIPPFLLAAMAVSKFLPSLPAIPTPGATEQQSLSHHARFNFSFEPILRRNFILDALAVSPMATLYAEAARAETTTAQPSKTFLSGIANTKSWFIYYGSGFAIRVPPNFQDITEPDDYNAGLSLYGDKAKPKTYAARFASPDGSEVVSVVVRPSNQLKITFLEAKDIADIGSLKEAARIFVPGGATLYSARAMKIKEEEDSYRNYYFYEFGRNEEHVALVAAVTSGKAIIAGATAPQKKWDEDGVRLRSAAISLTLL